MVGEQFSGFAGKTDITPIPNILINKLIPEIDNILEIKVLLHIFWLLSRKRGYPQYITFTELLNDPVIMECIPVDKLDSKGEMLKSALDSGVKHNIILYEKFKRGGNSEDAYFINSESGRNAIEKIRRGDFADIEYQFTRQVETQAQLLPDIFTLYEQNIGIITPIIADELKEVEQLYPVSWIESAIKEAVSLNKRNWRYIVRILERWAVEGKDDGKSRGHFKKETDTNKYIKGKYGHLVQR